MLQNRSLAKYVLRFAGERLQVIFGVDLLRVVQVLYVDEAYLVDHVLIRKLTSTLRRNEHVRIVINREIVLWQWK